MKIIQLTDQHLGREGEDTQGIDVRSNFIKALEIVEAQQPDGLVLTGDLCYRAPEREIYVWAKQQLDKLSVPFELIAGNHDDPAMMADVFGLNEILKQDGIYYTKEIAGQPILFLETSPAEIFPPQLEWLRKQLAGYSQDLIIFMHHPPMFCDVPFMDNNHAFKNREEVQEVLFSYPHNLSIFTGHYHVERTMRVRNIEVNITPSSFFQISRSSVEFKVAHRNPGYRVIEKDGNLIGHSVVYF